jgi:hypothetical protein
MPTASPVYDFRLFNTLISLDALLELVCESMLAFAYDPW